MEECMNVECQHRVLLLLPCVGCTYTGGGRLYGYRLLALIFNVLRRTCVCAELCASGHSEGTFLLVLMTAASCVYNVEFDGGQGHFLRSGALHTHLHSCARSRRHLA